MRFLTGIVLFLTIFLAFNGVMLSFEFEGQASLLLDPYSGRIFLEHNADKQLGVASISKLMTLVLVMEALERGEVELTDVVTGSPFAASKRGTRIWLEAGEEFTLEEMIYAIAVGSANDAAVAVAEFLAGSEDAFVQLMNERAKELGLTATKFVNCSGLSENEHTFNKMSARDVAILAMHALKVPGLMDYVSTYEYTMRPDTTKTPVLWNANKLLRRYYGVDGLKTGYTKQAGYCIAATAERENLRLIAVTLGHKDEAKREKAARALLDYGFRKYQSMVLYPKNAVVANLECPNGEPLTVDVVLPSDFYITVDRGRELDLTTKISLEQNFSAPLSEGSTVGTIDVYYEDELLGSSSLTIARKIDKASLFTLATRMGRALAEAVY